MVGGRNYVNSIYNRATQAQRQPGSAFKLFVYLAALESGMKPSDTMVDRPVDINGWQPRNSTRAYSGEVTLREAFARSINTISAQIGEEVGFSTIADMAHRFGITTSISTFPSMVLGTSEVRLIELTQAFASVANRGAGITPYAITKVTNSDGEELYAHERQEERVLVAPWVAAEMTDLLQAAVLTGTGRAAQIGRPVAGKTGTTSSNKDGWFVGFSSGLTTGVWMGRDNARTVAGLQGGTAPARAFHDFMRVAVARRPVQQFETQVPMPDWDLNSDDPFGGEYIDTDDVADGRRIWKPDGRRRPNMIRSRSPIMTIRGSRASKCRRRLMASPRRPQQLPPPRPVPQPPRSAPQPDPLQPRPVEPQ